MQQVKIGDKFKVGTKVWEVKDGLGYGGDWLCKPCNEMGFDSHMYISDKDVELLEWVKPEPKISEEAADALSKWYEIYYSEEGTYPNIANFITKINSMTEKKN